MVAAITVFGMSAQQVIGAVITVFFAGLFGVTELRKKSAKWKPAKPKTTDAEQTKPDGQAKPGPQHITRGSDSLPPSGAVDWVWDIAARMKYLSGSVTADSVLEQLLQGATGRVATDARISELETDTQETADWEESIGSRLEKLEHFFANFSPIESPREEPPKPPPLTTNVSDNDEVADVLEQLDRTLKSEEAAREFNGE